MRGNRIAERQSHISCDPRHDENEILEDSFRSRDATQQRRGITGFKKSFVVREENFLFDAMHHKMPKHEQTSSI